jgi:8-oxo-dGTP diphosphatase
MKVTVDAVVFSYYEKELHALLIKRAFEPYLDMFALAGGFLLEDETAEEGVLRKLKDETNVDLDYLEQLKTFTRVDRDPRERIISIAYYGLIDPSKHELITNIHAKEVKWFPAYSVPYIPLAFDHMEIYEYALERLRNKLQYEPIGFELLPNYFTMTELWELYNAVLGKELDRGNFIKKINKYELLNETSMKVTGFIGKPAKLFEFNKEKYDELKETKGLNFEL